MIYLYSLKFFHVLLAMGLLGTTGYCLVMANRLHKTSAVSRIYIALLITSAIVVLTGTLLVYPKQFTFHTPWIIAAYVLLGIFFFGVVLLWAIQYQRVWLSRTAYLIFIVLLLLIVHDAVTKKTALPYLKNLAI